MPDFLFFLPQSYEFYSVNHSYLKLSFLFPKQLATIHCVINYTNTWLCHPKRSIQPLINCKYSALLYYTVAPNEYILLLLFFGVLLKQKTWLTIIFFFSFVPKKKQQLNLCIHKRERYGGCNGQCARFEWNEPKTKYNGILVLLR